jgi:hypothetical protein
MKDNDLTDLNKTEVLIEINKCFKYVSSFEGMLSLVHLLMYVRSQIDEVVLKKIDERVLNSFMQIDKSVLDSLIEKVEKNRQDLIEVDKYIEYAREKFREDKHLPKYEAAFTAIPIRVFSITVEELLVFCNILEIIEQNYNIVMKEFNFLFYLENIESIKNMLKERLQITVGNL